MTTSFSQFDTQPVAIKDWLDNLPIASVGETARQLYMAMRDVNRQDAVPVKQHFNLLEGIGEPLELILPELHRHYAGKPLPLSQKRRKVADLYTQLLRQAILGYQQVIAHSIELSRFGWKKVVTTSVHRIFYYSSLLLCNYRQLHMPYQKGMWQQLYWIYQLVEKYNLLNAKVTGLGEIQIKTSIGVEFKKLLLHSLLSPNLFKPSELKDVLNNLDIWVQYVTIKTTPRDETNTTYAFTLETDYPPGLIAQNISQAENQLIDVRYLDISNLLNHITKIMHNTKSGVETIKLGRRHITTPRSLLILLNIWGRPPTRDGERRLIQGHAEVAIGVSAIHYVISSGRHTSGPVPDKPAKNNNLQNDFIISHSPTQSGELNTVDFPPVGDSGDDLWDSTYFEPESDSFSTAPSWTESMRMKVYSHLNAKVMNISKGGFCIALPQNGVEHIQTNELVACRGKTGQWQLGEIRWMVCPTTGPIRAGIQKHSQSVKPAEILLTSGVKAQPIKCLLGKNEDGHILFLPNMPGKLDHNEIQLIVDGKARSIQIQDSLFTTPVGSAHLFDFSDTHPASSQLAANSDDYKSIWASL